MIVFQDKSLVIFDVEVSDVEEAKCEGVHPEIIDLGAIRVSSDLTVIDTYDKLIRPTRIELVTDQTTRLTGITRGMLTDAPLWADEWSNFCEFAGYNTSRFAAFHALNDYGWLKAAYATARLGFPHPGFIFDIASWAYGFCSWYGIRPRTWGLKNVCKRLGVPYRECHRALPDAQAALGVLTAIQAIEDEHGSSGNLG